MTRNRNAYPCWLLAVVVFLGFAPLVQGQDLVLTATGPETAVAGMPILQEFTVDNVGAAAGASTFTEVLPLGVTYLADNLDACAAVKAAADGQETVTCSIPAIGAGESVDLNLSVLVEHDFLIDRGTGFTNSASVALGGEANTSNNSASTPAVLVSAEADLRITTFIQDNGPVPAGEQLNLVMVVDNLGPSTAWQVNVTETLITSGFVRANGCSLAVRTDGGSIDEFDCNFALSTGIFELATMGSNYLNPVNAPCDWDNAANPGEEEFCGTATERDQGRIIITIDMTADEAIEVEPFATVASETFDPNHSNNSSSDAGSFSALADLEVTKTAGSAVDPGGTATWDITVYNHGPSAAAEVLLEDILPADLVDGSVVVTGDIYDETAAQVAVIGCTSGTPGDPLDPATCDLGGLPADWSAELSITGTVDPNFVVKRQGIPGPLGITNDVRVSSTTADAVLGDAGNCAGNDPCPPLDDAPNFASATLTVNSIVPDLLLTSVATGERQVANQPGLILNPGVPGAFPEAPNYATSSSHVTAGRRLRYTLTATNNGTDTAHGVTVSTTLPAGVSHLVGTAIPSLGSCQLGTPGNPQDPMTCQFGDIAPASDAAVVFEVLVAPDVQAGSVLVQNSSVIANADTNPLNDLASSQIIVDTWADTRITMLGIGRNIVGWDSDLRRHEIEDLPGQATAGLGLRYLLTVQNNGPSAANNVQLLGMLAGQTDTGLTHDPLTVTQLPDGLCHDGSFLQEIGVFGPSGGKFGQVLWCNFGTIPSGTRKTTEWFTAVDNAVPDSSTLESGTFVWWGPASPPATPGNFLGFPFPQIPPELPTTDDPFLDDNFSETDAVIAAVADLSIETVVDGKAAKAGAPLDVHVTIINHGPSVATGVSFDTDLPFHEGEPAFTYSSVEQVNPATTEVTPLCSEIANTAECAFVPDSVGPGEHFSVDLELMVNPEIFGDPVLDLLSLVQGTSTDFHGSDNIDVSPVLINGVAADFFTELFAPAAQDLDGLRLALTPTDDETTYTACMPPSVDPILPDGSETYLVLGDDDFKTITLGGGKDVRFYGEKHNKVYVGSNGYISLGSGDLEYRPTLENHFDLPRVSAVFADLDPSIGGDVWWMQMDDRLVISFDAVPNVNPALGDNTFQVWMYFDGRLQLVYETLTGGEALAGLSTGDGLPHPFLASDLSTDYPICPEIFSDGFESGDFSAWDLP